MYLKWTALCWRFNFKCRKSPQFPSHAPSKLFFFWSHSSLFSEIQSFILLLLLFLPQLRQLTKSNNFFNEQWLPGSFAPRQPGKTESHQEAFRSNIAFPSPPSSCSFHLPSPQQRTKWRPLHCTRLTQTNHCLRVRFPNFTSSGAAFLADRNYHGPWEQRMSEDLT